MYAKELFLGISLYELLFLLGIVASLVMFDFLWKKKKLSMKSNRFYYILAIVAILGGYISAVLVQSFYNFIETGVFELRGMTFLGGFIGGAVIFIGGFLIFAKGEVRNDFKEVVEIAPVSITLAHALGRFGCFFAGCCYGKPASGFWSFLGVVFNYGDGAGVLRYPTQLFEAVFLLLLCAVLLIMNLKNVRYSLTVYLIAYGIFRFVIEFLRGDDRGSVGLTVSPSQLSSLILVVAALVLIAFALVRKYKPSVYNKILLFFKLEPLPDKTDGQN